MNQDNQNTENSRANNNQADTQPDANQSRAETSEEIKESLSTIQAGATANDDSLQNPIPL